ncbi:MAG: hypothetical protein NTZ79_12860, partial [Proteobacteria bacterium]|nr:hypothetical protein [Pseudomonadota bacterium]
MPVPTLQRLAAAIEAGAPSPLGATPTGRGVNFAVHSAAAQSVELCLFDTHDGTPLG